MSQWVMPMETASTFEELLKPISTHAATTWLVK